MFEGHYPVSSHYTKRINQTLRPVRPPLSPCRINTKSKHQGFAQDLKIKTSQDMAQTYDLLTTMVSSNNSIVFFRFVEAGAGCTRNLVLEDVSCRPTQAGSKAWSSPGNGLKVDVMTDCGKVPQIKVLAQGSGYTNLDTTSHINIIPSTAFSRVARSSILLLPRRPWGGRGKHPSASVVCLLRNSTGVVLCNHIVKSLVALLMSDGRKL